MTCFINMAARAKKEAYVTVRCHHEATSPSASVRKNPSYLTNKTRLTSIIVQSVASDYVQCKQAEGDADRLVVSTYQGGSSEPGKWHTR